MATMVKEKRREKKKTKAKTAPRSSLEREQPSISNEPEGLEDRASESKVLDSGASDPSVHSENLYQNSVEPVEAKTDALESQIDPDSQDDNIKLSLTEQSQTTEQNTTENKLATLSETDTRINTENSNISKVKLVEKDNKTLGNTYQDLNTRLERISIPGLNQNLNLEDIQNRLENPQAYLKLDEEARQKEMTQEVGISQTNEMVMDAMPSAPMFEEDEPTQYIQHHEQVIVQTQRPKVQSVSLEEAVKLYGGTEMERVKAWSEKEEAIVEAGPISGPEHPLVDLLSTFRSSLIAVDRECIQLSKGYKDEEKFRKSLWKVETRWAEGSEECSNGSRVTARVKFEHAEFLKERLPVAKLKLEGLLRDVQDSYCHHQHTALLTHCQIEELISETIRSNKKEIREALALVLKSLRLSDNAPTALAIALQRWAAVLSAALLDGRDISQLLHLLHHLFRQTRSVRWASRVIRSYIRAGDRVEAAQTIAVLDLLLAKAKVDSAVECTEDADDTWEEMDKTGSGAVCDGSLRERDLLALLRGFPLRDLVARIVLFPHSDVRQAREYDWGDRSGGSGVLKSCCGARTLLNTLQRGISSHPTYTKLHTHLRNLAVHTLHALAGLHLHSRDYYTPDLEQKITAELEACFCAGFTLLGAQQLHEVPATLLANHTAREYCCVSILALHDKTPKQLDFLPITLPVISCALRVRTITEAALDRLYDHELARSVMEFLFQTGIKRLPAPCKDGCCETARELLPHLLDAHKYLHTLALHTLAEYYQVDPLEPSSIPPLSPHTWRPPPGEVKHLLEDWSSRCPQLIQHLLLKMDYTPHSGLSLETQLTIGTWLCSWLRADPKRGPPPEWAWSVLRRMRVHRTCWGAWSEAPPPDPTPDDLFSMAFAVLSSSWGHCIPLICSEGVDALCKIATSRAGDAAHCLAPLMLIMAHSPESVALTPKFTELFNIVLKGGPTLVQRALGLGPEPGADVLLRLILNQLEGNHPGITRSSLISAWLHALWKPSLPASAQLDTLLLATRDWAAFDAHVNQLLQDKSASEVVNTALRNVSTATMLCSCVLRGLLGVQSSRGVLARVCQVLHVQRTVGDRIHVDNALKHIGANMSAEDLVIYKCASALLSAPAQRPAHLTLWALFFHLYLQRPPESMTDSTSPCGPLFFSGLIKSRVLAQLRKKLQETITYHQNEITTLKQNNREETPQAPSRSKSKKNVTEDGVLPMLNIRDMSGESSESSESDSDNSEQSEREIISDDLVEKKEDLAMLLKYHNAAESMCKEYLRWLDEGNNTRAMPHHADIARFIPEQVLAAAWSRELVSRRPPPLLEETPPPATPATPAAPPAQPFQSAVTRILSIKDCSSKRSRRLSIKSPLEDLDCRDPRTLLKLVDKHLANMEALAEEWCTEVARLASLDSAVWELVAQLRVKKPLPPVRKICSHADCKPVTIHLQEHEWCISLGAETGIDKNRQTARSLTRRLARPRPHAARSAAALVTIARRVESGELALRIVERAWVCARGVHTCAPAHTAITALVDLLAVKWLSHNGKICSELLVRWGSNCSSPLQQSLCGALVAPRRLPPAHCVPVYCAVLKAPLPPHIAFSFLSKFELSRWVQVAEPPERRELLEALVSAAQRWGISPEEECHVLLELLGVHTSALLSAQELSAHITRCARASTAGALPPAYWPHVTSGIEKHASNVPFDQLGHLLRELGVFWWEARSGLKSNNQRKLAHCGLYAAPTGELLHALSRAFTAAAVALSYSPERVALYVWSALQECWSPWVSPAPTAPPMLTAHLHTDMVKRLVDTIRQLMLDCPGIEEYLLARIFDYTVQTFFIAQSAGQECRVQLNSLLEEFRSLPWSEHQWFQASCLQTALQACASNAKEIQSWCSDTWRYISAATWVRGATDEQISPLLASLLYLFTAMTQHSNTLEQATRLPWWRLPQVALEEALERFFVQHHNPTLPYHDLPQFKVILFASELRINPSAPPPAIHSAGARHKRATAISRWVCSACAPALSGHVTSHAAYLLQTVTEIAPYLEGSEGEGEVEELLGRAVAVMCIEPAATAALPVWCDWVSSAPPRLVAACVSAASILTAFQYFAPLADVSIRAHCDNTQCGDWPAIYARLSSSPWREAAALLARTHLYAAYAVLHAHAHTHENMQTAFLALLAADVNYIENEAIVSVWICVACRVALSYPSSEPSGGAECGAAARALLARLAAQRARSLLKMVTLQADTNTPTARHRLLACLALCIVSPSESSIKAYEAACTAVLGSSPDVLSWGRAPRAKQLPRLAVRLFPNHEKYFKHELDLTPEDH